MLSKKPISLNCFIFNSIANPLSASTSNTSALSLYKSMLLYSSCLAGPIIAKSLNFFAVLRKLYKDSFSKVVSGFKIKAYSLLTLDNPKLFPLA